MLSLLSRIVIGSDSEKLTAKGEDDHEYSYSPGSSSINEDTDEEYLNDPMPIINIDQAELAREAIDVDRDDSLISSDQTDSCEDVKDDSALDGKTKEQVPVVIPSRDACRRIVELIEYYLSDVNLVKDMFLLKHVTKHREGYVSLKLLTSYKKVKRLTKDWRVVAHSLKSSKTLELNSDETKARRRAPLPQELEEDTRPFRTLLATHIDQDRSNMNQLAEFFGKFGDIISLQVHKPSGRTLNEVRQADRQHHGIVHTICAVVEYEKVYCARQTLRFITNNAEECKMKAMELPRKKQDSLLDVKNKADAESAYYSNSDFSEPPSPTYRGRTPRTNWRTSNSSISSTPSVSPLIKRRTAKVVSSPESSPPSPYRYSCGHPSPCSSPEDNHPARPAYSYDHYPAFQRYDVPGSLPLPRRQLPGPVPDSKTDPTRQKSRNLQNHNLDIALVPLSPWLRRRALANRADAASPSSTPSSSPRLWRRMDSTMLLPENVLRFPKGPDGTKGFAMHRTLLVQAAA